MSKYNFVIVNPQQNEPGYCHCGCGQKAPIAKENNTRGGWVKGQPLRYIRGHSNAGRVKENRNDIDSQLFWSKISITAPDDCWEWQGTKDRGGYGRFYGGGATRSAHRLSYELTYGKIPDKLLACHSCDNRACCNPSHIFLGTQKDNVMDAVKKGRWIRPSGERCRKAKYSDETIRIIRQRHSNGERTIDLAVEYGMAGTSMSRILNYRIRKKG